MKNVHFADAKTRESFEFLKKEDKILHDVVCFAFERIKDNCFCGRQVRSIPIEYFRKYRITNLWRYDMPRVFRLLYSVKNEEIIIISIITEMSCQKIKCFWH
jgi:hypothetical protein